MKMDVKQLVTVQVSRNRQYKNSLINSAKYPIMSNSLFSSDISTNYYIKIPR